MLIQIAEAMALLLMFVLIFWEEKVVKVATYALLIAVIGGVVLNYADFYDGTFEHESH